MSSVQGMEQWTEIPLNSPLSPPIIILTRPTDCQTSHQDASEESMCVNRPIGLTPSPNQSFPTETQRSTSSDGFENVKIYAGQSSLQWYSEKIGYDGDWQMAWDGWEKDMRRFVERGIVCGHEWWNFVKGLFDDEDERDEEDEGDE